MFAEDFVYFTYYSNKKNKLLFSWKKLVFICQEK